MVRLESFLNRKLQNLITRIEGKRRVVVVSQEGLNEGERRRPNPTTTAQKSLQRDFDSRRKGLLTWKCLCENKLCYHQESLGNWLLKYVIILEAGNRDSKCALF